MSDATSNSDANTNSASSISDSVNKTPTAMQLYEQMAEADLLRDMAEIMRFVTLLMVYGYATSLAAIEEQLRRRQFNSRLIACPFEQRSLPLGTECCNPFRIDSDDKARQCAFYVSLNVEGAESASKEQRAYGCASEKDNYNRLRSDCGFLAINSSGNSSAWNNALLQFEGEVQAADERAQVLAQCATCAACGRFPTQSTELRALNCCTNEFVCHEQCWLSHMQSEHADIQLDENTADQ